MGKSAVKGLFYICLIAATFILGAITIVAAFSGNMAPVDSVIMPLLGLAVPVLLIVNLITALCWALARKRWALIPLVVFFCNWGYLTSVFQLHLPKDKTPAGKYLKIATYNIHNFGGEITGYSCKEIARYMQQEGVDVLCFQEFGDNSDFPTDSIRRVLSHWSHALIPSEDSVKGVLPIAVFSRYPLANHRFITYQHSSNCSMMCDVVMGTDTIRLINNHLQTTSVSQKRRKWERELATDDTRREVRHLHLDIYYRPMLPVNAQMENDQIVLSVEAAQERFESIGFGDPDAAIRHVQALTAGVGRAAKINRIILPAVLQWLGEGQNPDMGLLNWRKLEENFGSGGRSKTDHHDSTSAAQRLCHILSNSRFLGDALNKSVESISWLGDDDNLQARTREALDVQTGSALERFGSNINEFATSMRAMRRHEIERIGLSWMSGVISDSDSLKAMTDVYDAIIDASLTWAVRHQIAEFGVETAPAGITVIAMGRYGGREVNFSSDADAILIYRPADDADDGQANAFAKKVVEDLRNILQGPTTLEPKIELDLDLRPEGKNGPLVRSYASCEEYYESWASTWERQALLRARYAAGDAELARDFLINIADPLRYPTTELTEAELQNIRKLKARMEAERLPRGVRRERHLKLGKGGLSDVEWTVQLMQLQHAGDIKDLRVNGTLEALDVLEAKKLISAIDAIQLRKAWTLCTAARNGSYLWSGRANQADILPDDIYSLGGIAVYLGYGAHRGQHFENYLLAVMRKCRDVCQRLFYGKTEGEAAAATTATASAATQQPQTAPRPRMHVIAPRLERNRRRAQR